MTAYIQKIDITQDGRIVVSGMLSSSNMTASLNEHVYVVPPADGLWGYSLSTAATAPIGLPVLIPFNVEAAWTGDGNARGARIFQDDSLGRPPRTTDQLKITRVDSASTSSSNHFWINAASYDHATKNIVLDVSYSGGCTEHLFRLEWDGSILKSNPPQYQMLLSDDGPADPCEAIIQTTLRFDASIPELSLSHGSTVRIRTARDSREFVLTIPS